MKPLPFHRLIRRLMFTAATVLSLSFLHAADEPPPGAPPEAWSEWAKWVEARHSAGDDQGHGPDVGGDEWAAAIGKQLGVVDAQGHGPDLKSKEWRAAVEKKLAAKPAAKPAAGAGEERQLLSSHQTIARFTGIKDHRCMGRTSLCPDRCGDSGKLASFTIVKYLDFQKPGEFGDPKQEQFAVLIEDNMKNPKVPEAILKSILALKPGDTVRLTWRHDYVTRGGSKFPERPIVGIEPHAEAAEKPAGDR